MFKEKLHTAIGAAFAGLALAAAVPAASNELPFDELRIIIPAAPGGGADRSTRGHIPYFQQHFDGRIIADNVPGGNMAVGIQHYLNNEPRDGTVLLRGLQLHFSGGIARGAEYSTEDFAVVAGDMPLTNSLWVHADSPWKTIDELIADIRETPGRISGNYLVGTATHIGLDVFADLMDIEIAAIPYTSGASQRADLLGQHVDFSITSLESTLAVLTEAEGRPLMVYSAERHPGAPDIPTLEEVVRAYNPDIDEVPVIGQQYFYAVHREVRDDHPEVFAGLVDLLAAGLTDEEFGSWASEQGWFIDYLGPDEGQEVIERLHAVSEQFHEILSGL